MELPPYSHFNFFNKIVHSILFNDFDITIKIIITFNFLFDQTKNYSPFSVLKSVPSYIFLYFSSYIHNLYGMFLVFPTNFLNIICIP